MVEYRAEVTQHKSEELIFIDETGAVLNMTPRYARCPAGERASAPKPTAKGSRISTIGALTTTGFSSAFCFEGTLNGDVFLYYAEHFLLPHLTPGKGVILEPVQNLFSNRATNASTIMERLVASFLSQFFHNRRHFSSQANDRSTTHRFGSTTKVCNSFLFTASTVAPRMSLMRDAKFSPV